MNFLRAKQRTFLAWFLAQFFLAIACHAALSPQLPSCTVLPDLAAKTLPSDWVVVEVDSNGNFYAGWASDVINWTALEQFGVPVWTIRRRAAGYWTIEYYTTQALEQTVCRLSRQIVFKERGEFAGILPKAYTVVRELQTQSFDPEFQAFFLTSLGAEFDVVLNGAIGGVWASTANEFRLPRVASDLVPVYRFFGEFGGGAPSHFYTADASEVAAMLRLIADGAKVTNERVVFMAPAAVAQADGTSRCASADHVPVRRMYQAATKSGAPSKYRYVTDDSLARRMQASDWSDQGATFCALRD